MSSLSNVEAKLPPGFRFHPRDDELIYDYLTKWVCGCPNQCPLLIEVDLNKCEPWDIPETASVGNKEWYFYSQKDKKYSTGLRTNRATLSGYWKATGKDRPIIRSGNLVGMRKTLVFYMGRAPKGRKTEWVMHEFRLEGTLWPGPETVVKDGWVLCRVFYKNRSDVHPTKQEPAFSSGNAYSQPISALMDPYITFNPIQPASTIDHYDEQVPCFSMFTQNQTGPTFSLFSHVDPPEILPKIMPSFGQILPDLGNYDSQSLTNSSCDKKAIRAVMNHITKIENSCNDINYNPITSMNCISSPSFGEGSPDSYLSEVDLSSMWNQY